MGNCCMRHSQDSNMVWAGDDWGSPMSSSSLARESRYNGYSSDEKPKKNMIRRRTEYDQEEEEEEDHKKDLSAEQRSALSVVDDDDDDYHNNKKNVMINSSTEVKVRITKKQLEELLGNVEVKGLSAQQLLEQLMNVTTTTTTTTTDLDSTTRHHRSWRPALLTIPEMMEAI